MNYPVTEHLKVHGRTQAKRYLLHGLPSRFLSDNLVGNIPWDGIVMSKFHGIVRTSTSHRPEIVHVAEHLSKRNMPPHHIHRSTALHSQDSSTTTVEVTNDLTIEL